MFLALALLIPAAPVLAQEDVPPPSLMGESFAAGDGGAGVEPGEVEVTANCEPGVAPSTFMITYTASGPAVGPYPGTFYETGTVTVEVAELFRTVLVTQWDARFTIDSPVGRVAGEKHFNPEAADRFVTSNGGACSLGPSLRTELVHSDLDYEATIRTPTGDRYTDSGRALAMVGELCDMQSFPEGCNQETEREVFAEYFAVSNGVVRVVETYGMADGGGQVASTSDSDEGVTFGLTVEKREDPEYLHGQCNVLDDATGDHIVCRTVTDYQQVGNTATFEGVADVNGVEEEYRITVQDNGEPNQGVDTFSIVTETYEAAGNVPEGNVQVHPQDLEDVS